MNTIFIKRCLEDFFLDAHKGAGKMTDLAFEEKGNSNMLDKPVYTVGHVGIGK